MSSERSDALRWAAHVRDVRARTLDALASGGMSLTDCFEADGDPALRAIHMGNLLEALPGVRKVDARRAMESAGVAGDVSLGATSARDRAKVLEIAERLGE